MLVIGLTGKIGSGKSTAAKIFSSLGADVIYADKVARDVIKPSSKAYIKIVEKLGKEIINFDQTINRAKLRDLIFKEPKIKSWLEKLTHPLIKELINQEINKLKSNYCILEIPLIYKREDFPYLNRILSITSNNHLEKASIRDNCKVSEIQKISKTQPTNKKILELSDDIIENNSTISELEKKLKELHKLYLKLSGTN